MISEEEISLSTLNRIQTSGTTGDGISVLLAEDDKALRRYLEVVLQRSGYAVQSAVDGLEAMKLLLKTSIDLVITDAVMPNLTGYELCRFIRSSHQLKHLPIILLSALDPKNSAGEAEQADAFLAKPVAIERLLETITYLLEAKVSQ